jgi:uncharacterized protein YqeY
MLKQQIQSDFLIALKERNERAKLAINGLKTKITEAEKLNGSQVSDDDIIKIINKSIKQREESRDIYEKAGRKELAKNESTEIDVLRKYLPKQMTLNEIENELKIIVNSFNNIPNKTIVLGKSIGEFNKKFNGMANITDVRTILEKLLK